jgi:hypothetical protein
MTPTTEENRNAETPPQQPQVESKGRATLEIIRILADKGNQKELLQQLIDAETARDLFDQDYRAARIYAMSGQFDDIKGATTEQAIASAMSKIRIGRSWGMNESDSIAFIYWNNGKPAVMTEILATKIQQAGYGWDIDWSWEQSTHKNKPWKRCTGCTLWLKAYNSRTNSWEPVVDRNDQPVSAGFSEADADHAMIWEKGKQIPLSSKWNFQSWGQDMYFWRAMSRLRKYHLTSIMRGAQQYELRNEVYVEPMAPQIAAPESVAPESETPEPENQQPPAATRPLREVIIEAEQTSLLDETK